MRFKPAVSGRGLLVAVFLSIAGAAFASERPPTLTIGSPLPSFSLPGIDGKTYTDSPQERQHPGDRVHLRALPDGTGLPGTIKKLVTDYSSKGVKLVAINPNHAESVRLDELAWSDLSDSFDEIKERAEQEKFNFVWLDDGVKQEVSATRWSGGHAARVHLRQVAEVLRFEGRIDDSERESLATEHETRDALDALLAGKEPPVTSTRVFGCSVKWADKVAEYAKYKENGPQSR